jgi:hypothetical protein
MMATATELISVSAEEIVGINKVTTLAGVSHECVIVHPTFIGYMDFQSLLALTSVNRSINRIIRDYPETVGYWESLCRAFGRENGLYTRYFDSAYDKREDAKRYFFAHLWGCRRKLPQLSAAEKVAVPSASSAKKFSVRVVCRFRPGESANEMFSLPLHQFLKLKRKQPASLRQGHENTSYNSFLVGEQDPAEYLDPFLGTLMREPVLLLSSNRIVDRSIALHALLRTGKDPFNNKPLKHMDQIVSQPELQQQIQDWKVRRNKSNSDKLKLTNEDVKPLVDEASCLNADLIQALMDAEQLTKLLSKAERAAKVNSSVVAGDDGNTDVDELDVDDVITPETDIVAVAQPDPIVHDAIAASDLVTGAMPDFDTNFVDDSDVRAAKQLVTSTVVDINAKNAVVAMQLPGAGVKPFYFSTVHNGLDSQTDVYDRSVRESVEASLNGYSATVICYGQTGAGKTFTFFGPSSCDHDLSDHIQASSGMIVRAMSELLLAKNRLVDSGVVVNISVQYIEIYDEKMTDLLSGQKCQVSRVDGAVSGARVERVDTFDDVVNLLSTGQARKRFAATAMNERSSRSHTALIVKVGSVFRYMSKTLPSVLCRSRSSRLWIKGFCSRRTSIFWIWRGPRGLRNHWHRVRGFVRPP